jgi:hypothetical protein
MSRNLQAEITQRILTHLRNGVAPWRLGEPIADAMSNSTVSDFLDALDSHPHYRARDVDRLAAWQDQGAGQAFVDAINDEIAAIEAFAAQTGFANPDDHE